MITSFFRFSFFAVYVGLVFFLPFSVLWGQSGFVIALFAWLIFLAYLGVRAPLRIVHRLGAREITVAEAPYLFHITEELCRRCQIPVPKLWSISSKVPNFAVAGYRKSASHLIITSETLKLKRTEQTALIARGIVLIAQNDSFNATWLCQFLNFIETCVGISKKSTDLRRETDSLRHFLLQTVLYPASMAPIYLLGKTPSPFVLDRRSILLSKQPLALSEVYRKIEYSLQTQLFPIPLSTFHLFLAEPRRHDVLTNVLFKRRSLIAQIRELNPLAMRS